MTALLLSALILAAVPSSTIRNVSVYTEDGRTVRFYDDLVQGRVVAINFVFTNCTTVCPLMGARFAKLQSLTDVPLISVTLDPANDTPSRLSAWRSRFGGRAGWTLVTGAKSDIDALLTSLGTNTGLDHAPLIVIVDARGATPVMQRVDGLTDTTKLAKMIHDVVASK